jgi:hypothetical protein
MTNGRLDYKTKMISLRLSEVEFEFLKTRHQTYGARSVSDLARLAVQWLMQGSDPAKMPANISSVTEAVANLKVRVATLENQMNRWGRESHDTAACVSTHAGQEDA